MSNKICVQCHTDNNKAYKWYSGPTCRSCYYKQYHLKNREKHLSKMADHRAKNKTLINSQKAEWTIKNRDHIRQYKATYKRERYHNDINFRMLSIARRHISRIFNGVTKVTNTLSYIGCSTEELCSYLESKFQPGMTWDNYGYRGWHIDHIKPLSSFNLTNEEERNVACHYTNLQPLWAKDNLKKGDSLDG